MEKLPPGFICRTKKSECERGVYYKSKYESRRSAECCFFVLFHPLGFYRRRCEKCKERGSARKYEVREGKREKAWSAAAALMATEEGEYHFNGREAETKRLGYGGHSCLRPVAKRSLRLCVSLKRIVGLTQARVRGGKSADKTNIHTHLVACFLVFSAAQAQKRATRYTSSVHDEHALINWCAHRPTNKMTVTQFGRPRETVR